MSIIQTDTGVKITSSVRRNRKGAKKSKANRPGRVNYRNSGRKFKNHAKKLENLAKKFERRISVGATPPNKVEGLKAHIKGLKEAAKRWSVKR